MAVFGDKELEHKQIVAVDSVEKNIHYEGGEAIGELGINVRHIKDIAKTKQ
jgi:hypothetical protein